MVTGNFKVVYLSIISAQGLTSGIRFINALLAVNIRPAEIDHKFKLIILAH